MLEENDFSEAAILGQEWSGKFRSSDSFNEIERIHVRSDRDFFLWQNSILRCITCLLSFNPYFNSEFMQIQLRLSETM